MKFLATFLLFATTCFAQVVRFDAQFPVINTQNAIAYLTAPTPPNSPIPHWCNSPANGVPCTNYATTYTAGNVACPNGAQDTPQPATASACQQAGDAQGNIGAWLHAGTYDYTVTINGVAYGPYTISVGLAGGGALPTTGQVGDCLKNNVYGDSQWDTVSCAVDVEYLYVNNYGNNIGNASKFGPWAGAGAAIDSGAPCTQSGNTPTGNIQGGSQFQQNGTPATTAGCGVRDIANGNNGILFPQAIYRWSNRFSLGSTTNSRFYMGVAVYGNGNAHGTNGTNFQNTNKFATDTPQSDSITFRYSSTTDTTWKALTCLALASCTVTDTGVTAASTVGATTPHLFEFAWNANNTAVNFFIDGVLVATNTTNLPTAANADQTAEMFWTEDNKNSGATLVTCYFWSMKVSVKY